MADVVEESDVVITTAAVRAKKAPADFRPGGAQMKPGSVIVDLAAEREAIAS
jgi:NAD/NADP transhydrogenase alpha subunit